MLDFSEFEDVAEEKLENEVERYRTKELEKPIQIKDLIDWWMNKRRKLS